MVTRQYVDVVQDDLLEPYFEFGPGFVTKLQPGFRFCGKTDSQPVHAKVLI